MSNRSKKRLGFFERYLTAWVALCMLAGMALGKIFPGFTGRLSTLDFGQGSQVNVHIAALPAHFGLMPSTPEPPPPLSTLRYSTTKSPYLLAVLLVKSESEMREDYYSARIESAECRSCT